MHLRDYYPNLSKVEREALAKKVRVSVGHLRNVVYGAPISPFVVQQLEIQTGGKVTRKAHFPDSYMEIWPDLAATAEPSIVANSDCLNIPRGAHA